MSPHDPGRNPGPGRPPSSPVLSLGLILAATLVVCLPGTKARADGLDTIVGESSGSSLPTHAGQVFSLLDYFESGRRAVQVYVANAPRRITEPRLGRVIDEAARACVRIEIRSGTKAAGYELVSGSGVLIDRGRRVLTAGHIVEDLQGHDVTVTLSTGETRRARTLLHDYQPLGQSGRDWAILEIAGSSFRYASEVEFGDARPGDLAIMLGYPDQIGINATGNVVFSTGVAGEVLNPLTTLGTVADEDEITLVPRAGAIPTGGMSGGPVFDSRGRLLGIFVSTERTDDQGQASYAFRATPVRAVRRHLKH